MVFSPKLKITIVQNASQKFVKSVDIIDERVDNMIKVAAILEQRIHTTRSPEVILRDQIMLKKIKNRLSIIGYNI